MTSKNPSFLLYAFMMLFTFIAGCSNASNPMPNEMPLDFEFSLTYGINGAQKVDTFNNIVIKDLVEDGTAEATIAFNEQEMKAIYMKMAEMNIMNERDLAKNQQCRTTPSSYSDWQIRVNGETKNIEYESYCGDYPKDVKKLVQLEEYIHEIISSKEEYKKLPKSKGFYE